MPDWIQENVRWVFSGVGVVILGALLGGILRWRNRGGSSVQQHLKGADGSKIVQAGRDVIVNQAPLVDDQIQLLTEPRHGDPLADEQSGRLTTINLTKELRPNGELAPLSHAVDQLVDDALNGKEMNLGFEVDEYSRLKKRVEALEGAGPGEELFLLRDHIRSYFRPFGEQLESVLGTVIEFTINELHLNRQNAILSSVNETAELLAHALPRFSPYFRDSGDTRFDVFDPKMDWSTAFYLTDDELSRLMDKFDTQYVNALTSHFGLDAFDVGHQVRIERMIPSVLFEYFRNKYGGGTPLDIGKMFNIMSWRIGLA